MKVPERERDGMGPGDANFGEELEGSSVSRSETERSGGASLSSVNYFSRSTTIRIPGYLPVFLHHLAAKC